MSNQQWCFDTNAHAHIGCLESLPSDEQSILRQIFNLFGNRSFMRHHAQAFDQFVIANAYAAEEAEFKKTVEVVNRSSVPKGSNVISSHVIYNVKIQDENSLKLKAHIAPHGNEDSVKSLMKLIVAFAHLYEFV